MASSHRLVRSRPVRAVRRHPFTRLLVVGIFCGLGYVGLTNGAFGPATDLGDIAPPQVALATASISYSGVDPVITGSVDHLFETASFTGPNRAEKTDRMRPPVDVLALSRSFEEVRVRLASLRGTPIDPTDLGQSRLAAIDIPATGDVEIGPRMSVASIDPATAAALDAIAGIAPEAALPMPVMASEQLAYARSTAPVTGGFSTGPSMQVSDKELWCLATAIYFEARGETYRGQVAVAQVVLNRVKDYRYPDTICGVVFQNQSRRNSCQFSFACDGIPETVNDRKSWAQAEDIAKRFTDGQLYLTEVGDATHYHASYVRPAWAPRMTKVTQIGLHIFYKFKRGWLFG
ncbi:cell wall hydrolase [Devosia ginsengisoli]|uniref:Cell wall hydrolase n=1 Tax=Devosia ginsengisoli TaxID=400770 RepID=A0A5B8LNB6_9HYPH|nr:cell wall hydrolase [Devosia ginsengisoli]QDZ09459.1 cell wall hydrolase [Devosia ginsengisoli]